jgi:hypothetical protein
MNSPGLDPPDARRAPILSVLDRKTAIALASVANFDGRFATNSLARSPRSASPRASQTISNATPMNVLLVQVCREGMRAAPARR